MSYFKSHLMDSKPANWNYLRCWTLPFPEQDPLSAMADDFLDQLKWMTNFPPNEEQTYFNHQTAKNLEPPNFVYLDWCQILDPANGAFSNRLMELKRPANGYLKAN
jgi:hypothetical protein